jgi:hypothetical protein
MTRIWRAESLYIILLNPFENQKTRVCADIDADIEMHAHAFAFAHDNQGRACHLHMQILLRDARAKGFAPVICVNRKGGERNLPEILPDYDKQAYCGRRARKKRSAGVRLLA